VEGQAHYQLFRFSEHKQTTFASRREQWGGQNDAQSGAALLAHLNLNPDLGNRRLEYGFNIDPAIAQTRSHNSQHENGRNETTLIGATITLHWDQVSIVFSSLLDICVEDSISTVYGGRAFFDGLSDAAIMNDLLISGLPSKGRKARDYGAHSMFDNSAANKITGLSAMPVGGNLKEQWESGESAMPICGCFAGETR